MSQQLVRSDIADMTLDQSTTNISFGSICTKRHEQPFSFGSICTKRYEQPFSSA
jgi:hypothetical protein